jgi:hypothetical protein
MRVLEPETAGERGLKHAGGAHRGLDGRQSGANRTDLRTLFLFANTF